jgi:hypothetical protein
MAYTPDPQNPAQPTPAQVAGNMAYELQAIKAYLQSLVTGGNNFYYIGSSRNRFKNGGMRVAQRGTGITITAGNSGYTLDQWIVASTGGSTAVSQVTNTQLSLTDKLIQLAPAGAVTAMLLQNKMEAADCVDLTATTPVTISGFYQASNLSAAPLTITLYTPSVADNWSSTLTQVGTGSVTLIGQVAGVLQYFSTTITLGADCSNGVMAQISWPSTPGGYTFQFTHLQLEKGSYYTPFEFLPIEEDLRRCQRYYEVIETVATPYGSLINFVSPKCTKRTAPTLNTSLTSGSGAVFAVSGVTGNSSYYQMGNNSVVTNAIITASAEL